MPYRQLNAEERTLIAKGLVEGLSVREMARRPDRAPSTISRELTRNHTPGRSPSPPSAQSQTRSISTFIGLLSPNPSPRKNEVIRDSVLLRSVLEAAHHPRRNCRRAPARLRASIADRTQSWKKFRQTVAFAMSQPEDMDVNEILFRPTRQEL